MIKNILIGVAVVLGISGTVFGMVNSNQIQPLVNAASQAVVKLGSTIEINPYWYSGGIAWGRADVLHDTMQIQLPPGQNQVTWFPNLGRDVIIDQVDLSMTGTASSSYQVNLGTTTSSANIADVYSLITKPFWSQAIDSFQIATGSTEQAGATSDFLTTMGVSSKSGYPDELQVPQAGGVRLMLSNFCLADGACNTATSSNRGVGTVTATMFYHYRGPD